MYSGSCYLLKHQLSLLLLGKYLMQGSPPPTKTKTHITTTDPQTTKHSNLFPPVLTAERDITVVPPYPWAIHSRMPSVCLKPRMVLNSMYTIDTYMPMIKLVYKIDTVKD